MIIDLLKRTTAQSFAILAEGGFYHTLKNSKKLKKKFVCNHKNIVKYQKGVLGVQKNGAASTKLLIYSWG